MDGTVRPRGAWEYTLLRNQPLAASRLLAAKYRASHISHLPTPPVHTQLGQQ